MKKTRKELKLSVTTSTIRVLQLATLVEPVLGGVRSGNTNYCESNACDKIII
jgi:hypothetical protein